MEKIQIPKNNTSSKKFDKRPSSLVWDCESTLYDSFELNSFRKSLDLVITGRTLSMPHLSSTDHDRRHCRRSSSSFDDPLPPLPPLKTAAVSKSKNPAYKLTRSVRKLLKSVFKMNKTVNCSNYSSTSSGSPRSWDANNNNTKKLDGVERRRDDRLFVVCDNSAVLTTIPEGPEVDHCATSGVISPEIGSLVRRTASDRFLVNSSSSVAAPLGISCA